MSVEQNEQTGNAVVVRGTGTSWDRPPVTSPRRTLPTATNKQCGLSASFARKP